MLTLFISAIAGVLVRRQWVPWRTALISFSTMRIALFIAAVWLNVIPFTVSAVPRPNIGSVNVERDPVASVQQDASSADSADIENIQRINRALIEYGRRQGLTQRGYENQEVKELETFEDPHLVTLLLAQREGTGVNTTTASLSEPYVYSAMMLANMGILSGGDDLYSGSSSSEARLALVEQFMKAMNEPGLQYVDPSAVYAEVYQRVQKTDPNDMTTGQDDPGFPYNQIAITNSALVTTIPYLTENWQGQLVVRLNNAADEYMLALATDKSNMSYPEYLQSIGAEAWL